MRRNNTLFILYVFLAFIACEQSKELRFPAALNNQKTDKHIEVSGTNLSIIPPEGFRYWSEEQIFHSVGKDSCMILLREDHSKNYFDYLSVFRPTYEKAYKSVVDETHLTINGFPATILFIHQDNNYDGYHILFGDSTFVAYIMTVQPNSAHKYKEKIVESLTTIFYDK
jgi:hypothetical protein